MADEQRLGKLYIEIEARLNKLEAGLKSAESKGQTAARRIESSFSKMQVNFRTELLSKKIKDVIDLQKKLQNELEKKIDNNASVASIEVTRRKLNEVEGALKGVRQEADKTSPALKNSFGGLKDIAAGAGIAFGVQQLSSFIIEAFKLSANLEVLKSNFNGTTADLELFRTATAGTVSDASLIALSNQATDLGVSLEDQAILFSLAEDAADKYGGGVEAGFAKVVAATEGSSRGLKALGIQKEIYEKIVKDLAAAQGDVIDNLDAETQKQIRLEAIIKASGLTLEDVKNKTKDSADKIGELSVNFEKLKESAGEGLKGTLLDISDGIKKITEAGNSEGFIKFIDNWAKLATFIPRNITIPAVTWVSEQFGGGGKQPDLTPMNTYQPSWLKDKLAETSKQMVTFANETAKANSEVSSISKRIKQLQAANEEGMKSGTMTLEQYQANLNEIQNLENKLTGKQSEEYENRKQLTESFYNYMGAAARGYYDYSIQQIEKEAEAYRKAGRTKEEVDAFKIKKQNELTQKYVESIAPANFDYSGGKSSMPGNITQKNIMRVEMQPVFVGVNPAIEQIDDEMNAMFSNQVEHAKELGNTLVSSFNLASDSFVAKLNQALQIALNIAKAIREASADKSGDNFSNILSIATSILPGLGFLAGLFHNGGTIENRGGVPLYAARGLDYIVPAGYPNDSFPIMVESGERVQVTPASQVAKSGGSDTAVLHAVMAQTLTLFKGLQDIARAVGTPAPVYLDGYDITKRGVQKNLAKLDKQGVKTT